MISSSSLWWRSEAGKLQPLWHSHEMGKSILLKEDGRVHSLPASAAVSKTLWGLSPVRKLSHSPIAVSSSWSPGPHCPPSCWHLGMPATKAHSPSLVARTQTCTRTCVLHTLPHTIDCYSHPIRTWILSSPHTQGHTFTRVLPVAGPDLWPYQ